MSGNFDEILEKGVKDIQYLTVNYVMQTLLVYREEAFEFLYPDSTKHISDFKDVFMKVDVGSVWRSIGIGSRKKLIAFSVKFCETGTLSEGERLVWENGEVKIINHEIGYKGVENDA